GRWLHEHPGGYRRTCDHGLCPSLTVADANLRRHATAPILRLRGPLAAVQGTGRRAVDLRHSTRCALAAVPRGPGGGHRYGLETLPLHFLGARPQAVADHGDTGGRRGDASGGDADLRRLTA